MSYAWSLDEEHFQGEEPSREAAIAACLAENDLAVGSTFETGLVVSFTGKSFAPGNPYCLIEDMQEQAQEECGEAAEDWLEHLSREAQANLEYRLVEMIDQWLTANDLLPTFWRVTDTETHTVPEVPTT